jgi:hypothetical protein
MKPVFKNTRVSLVMPSIDQVLALLKFFGKAPSHTGSASAAASSTMPLGSRIVTVALESTALIKAAGNISTSAPPSVPALVPAWLCRHGDKVASGRSFARQNSLTLWPLFSNSANHSVRSAGVELTLVLGLVAAGTATFIAAFVIRQVLLVENLPGIYQSVVARLPVDRGMLSN